MSLPDKVFVRYDEEDGLLAHPKRTSSEDTEYHLAQWHDAKTDPPKVGSYYLTFQRGYPMSVDYFILHEGRSIFEEGEPDFWMPLPEPPNESWTCSNCGYMNSGIVCTECGKPKENG